ncbi:hypothetical protein [Spongiactinospora sp. 9N601]
MAARAAVPRVLAILPEDDRAASRPLSAAYAPGPYGLPRLHRR